jgi:hypothetical protein
MDTAGPFSAPTSLHIWFSIFHIFLPPGFLPDHMPQHPGDPGKLQAYAFGYGYINALINTANSEVS